MKNKYLLLLIFVVIAIAAFFPNIPKVVEKHRRVQNLAIFQKIGLKINRWDIDKNESFPGLTNTEFLATLAPEEATFIKANIISFPNDEVFMQTKTVYGTFVMYRAGQVVIK